MNEKNLNKKAPIQADVADRVVASNDELDSMSTAGDEEKLRAKSSIWKWLVLIVLLLGLGFFVATTPSLSKYLPKLPGNSIDRSSSGRKIKVEPNIFTPDSSSKTEKTVESYVALTLALPVMVAILTLLTFINTILFLAMSGKLSNIKDAINDLYNKISEK